MIRLIFHFLLGVSSTSARATFLTPRGMILILEKLYRVRWENDYNYCTEFVSIFSTHPVLVQLQ